MAVPTEPCRAGRVTGLHVPATLLAGFGTVIAVDETLAHDAARTFPGPGTPSAYVAAQALEAERAA